MIQSQKTFGQFFQSFRFVDDDIDVASLHLIGNRSVLNGHQISLDGSQRGTKVVRDICNEIALCLCCMCQLIRHIIQ